MDRREVERVQQELDAILDIVSQDRTIKGEAVREQEMDGTMDKKEANNGREAAQRMDDGRGGRPPRRRPEIKTSLSKAAGEVRQAEARRRESRQERTACAMEPGAEKKKGPEGLRDLERPLGRPAAEEEIPGPADPEREGRASDPAPELKDSPRPVSRQFPGTAPYPTNLGAGQPERWDGREKGGAESSDWERGFQEEPGPWEEGGRGGRGLRLLKPSDGYLAAFFVPVAIMIIIFAQRGIFPFGEESFLRTDMYHQYAPFFSEFHSKLTEGGSLFYSWDVGMGVNFSALYAYYLASPFNWLLALCPKGLIIEFMTYGIVLKTGLAGLSFAWYLRKRFGTKDFGVGFFGIFYAMSGYMAAYSWNIMWLDCIILLPLILLGLERLVWEKKPFLYCLALGASILSNYYISIMTCLFMVMYFFALLVLRPPKGVKAFFGAALRFSAASLAAGGLAAAVLLPEIYALKSTASGNFSFPQTISSYFSIFDMLARHLPNVQTEIGLDHWPNLYCGVAVLLLFGIYLGCREIRLREKAVYCAMFLVFFASFSVNVLNFIWHGFHYPNSLPCRQSFIYIALMLTVCYEAYMNLDRIRWKQAATAFWISAGFVILAEKLVDNKEQFHFSVFYTALVYLAAYCGLMLLYRRRRRGADLAALLTLALVSVEAAVNMSVTSVPTTSRTAYIKDNQDVEELMEDLRPDTFYRVEKVNRKSKNDGAWMNFPSVSLFSSTANAALSSFFQILGCESSTNAYSITGSTPLVDCLLSVRYALYDEEQADNDRVKLIGKKGDTWLYENICTLPVAFMLPGDVEGNWILDSGNPAQVQNDLCTLVNADPVLVEQAADSDMGRVAFTAEQTGDYYVYVTDSQVVKVTAYIGDSVKYFDNVNRGFLLELGILQAGQEVTLENGEEGNVALAAQVWRADTQALEQVYTALNRNPLTVTKWTDVRLEGVITADEPGTMFTSIPYDRGWTLTVDGQEVQTRPLFDTLLGAELTAGTHTIVLTYMPQGLKAGAVLTAASAALIAAAAGVSYYSKKKKEEQGEQRL